MFLHPFCFFSQGRERQTEREREREKKLNSSQQFIILDVVRKVDHSLQLKPFFQMDTGGHMLPRVKLVRRNWPCCSSCLTRMSHRRTSALLWCNHRSPRTDQQFLHPLYQEVQGPDISPQRSEARLKFFAAVPLCISRLYVHMIYIYKCRIHTIMCIYMIYIMMISSYDIRFYYIMLYFIIFYYILLYLILSYQFIPDIS